MVVNKKVKRTMMESKSQYVGSLVLIIISCFLYTMFNQLTSNMTRIKSSFEKNYVQEDANFLTDKKLNDIKEMESKFNFSIEAYSSIDYSVSKGNTLRIFSENSKINLPAIIKGKKLSSNDILIDPAYASVNHLKVGNNIKLYNKNYKISGFMSLPNYIYPLKMESDLLNNPKNFGIAVISKKDFSNISTSGNFYSVKYKGNSKNRDKKIQEFKNYLQNKNVVILKWINIDENPRVTFVTAKIDGIKKISSSLPIAILLLTCVLTGVVIWRMLKREFTIIGTLYALGYRKKEIAFHYSIYPLSIALIGGATGTFLGLLTVKPMLNLIISYFNMPVGSIKVNIIHAVISIILPVIFLGICGYLVINKALKYSPVELMKGGKDDTKVSFIEKRLRLEKFRFSAKFKIREQLRSIPRTIFLLLGVVLATMLLLLGFASKSSLDSLMKDNYEDTYKYKYEYSFNSIQQGIPYAGEVFSAYAFNLKSDSKKIFSVYGINSNSKYIHLENKSGKKLNTDRIIITKSLAEKLKVKERDSIYLVSRYNEKQYVVKIDSIANTYSGEFIYMPIEKLNLMLNYPQGSYSGLWSGENLNIPESKLLSASTIGDHKKAFDSVTKPMQQYVAVISIISFIIGLIVIYVVTSLIIEENKENISLMKILGYKKKEVYSLILNSSFIVIIFGYLLGIPLLLISLSILYKSITKGMNINFPVTINYIYILFGFIVMYITYEISKALSRRKVNRISMVEALKGSRE